MWVSVLLLALAVNLEPTRICLVPLLLARDRPRQQLIAFLAGNLTMSLGFGLLALFSFRHVPLATASVDGGLVKIVLGAIALVAAVVMALRWMSRRQAEAQGTAGPRQRYRASALLQAKLQSVELGVRKNGSALGECHGCLQEALQGANAAE